MFFHECVDVGKSSSPRKMKMKDGRSIHHPDKGVKIVPLSFIIILLCGISFYLGGVFIPIKNTIDAKDITDVITKTDYKTKSVVAPLKMKSISFPECGIDYQDYTPCTDPRVNHLVQRCYLYKVRLF